MHLHWAAIAPCLVPPAHVRAASADEQAAWYVVQRNRYRRLARASWGVELAAYWEVQAVLMERAVRKVQRGEGWRA